MRHFKLLSIVVFVCALAETWCIRSEEKLLNRLQCAALQGAVSALVEHEVTIPMGTNLSNHYCYGEGKAIPGYKVDFKHQHVNKLVVHKNNADACSDSMRGLLRIFAEYDPNKVKCSFEQQKREFRIGFNPASNKEMCFEC